MPLSDWQSHLRRAILFLVAIATPVVVGVARSEPRAALLGAVAGMVLAFADNDGPLGARLRLLALAAGAMAAGGAVGFSLRGSELALGLVFGCISIGVGFAASAGREPLLAARNGAVAFAVASSIAVVNASEFFYLGGAFALTAISRSIDHWIAGPLPRLPGPPARAAALTRGESLRYALAYSAAATSALVVGRMIDPIHALWVVTTALVVMQPDAGASYRRIRDRVIGTLLGVGVAWLLTVLLSSAPALCIAVVVIAPLIPHHLTSRYWLHTALIALLVLIVYDLVALKTGGIAALFPERIKDMLIGCALASAATAIAFPPGSSARNKRKLVEPSGIEPPTS